MRIFCSAHHLHRVAVIWMILLSLQPFTLARSVHQEQAEVRKLEAGKQIDRKLSGGESHTYELEIQAGQYLNVVVEQLGIDVVVQVIAPDGKQAMEVDSPNGIQGPELVTMVAEVSGIYRFKVRSLEKAVATGKYEIKVVELRSATNNDRVLQEATQTNSRS